MTNPHVVGTILITGASGTIGSKLIPILIAQGFSVHLLTRKQGFMKGVIQFSWNIEQATIDEKAFENVTHIIHLAGENLMDKTWTIERKKAIVDSRVKSTQLLFSYVKKLNVPLQKFISASAVGFYGIGDSSKLYDENSNAGNDFLSQCCLLWENAANEFSAIADVVIFRLGIVLDKEKGAFPKLIKPIQYGIVSSFGSGLQPFPWIHINDVCKIFLHSLSEKNFRGVFNVVAPEQINNSIFTLRVAKAMNRKLILPNVPSFFLKILLGERSEAILFGQKVSQEKLQNSGFEFSFPTVDKAIQNLLH